MGENEEFDDIIMKQFAEMMREQMPNRVITNFIVIAEVSGGSTQELSLSMSDTMTPWLASGMLNAAMQMVHSGEYQFPFEEEHNE